jgi:hypothetical protein
VLTPKQKIANLTCWENHSRRDCRHEDARALLKSMARSARPY